MTLELAGHGLRQAPGDAGRAVTPAGTGYRLLFELSVKAGRAPGRDLLMSLGRSSREPGDSGVVPAYVRPLRRELGASEDNPGYVFNEPRAGHRLWKPESRTG